MILFKNKNELIYLHQTTHYGSYDTTSKLKYKSIGSIMKYFRTMINIDRYCEVLIESKFKNVIYPVFDLDCKSKYELFKTLYKDTPYVIFISSYNKGADSENEYHYWGIIDEQYKKIKKLILNQNWKLCNDQDYINFSTRINKVLIRGIYENKNNKPKIFEKNGVLSENFELFISKLENHYNNNGFELSILRYKDTELLIKFNRKIKLNKINCSEEESEI